MNLSALSNLISVGDYLSIYNNNVLDNLDALNNIQSIGRWISHFFER